MKQPKILFSFLHSKLVLYVVAFIAVTNVLCYLVSNNLIAVIVFLATSWIISRYTGNMIIVLGVPCLTTGLIAATKTSMRKQHRRMYMMREAMGSIRGREGMTSGSGAIGASDIILPPMDPAPDPVSTITPERMSNKKKNERVDYAATVEDAYDDLNKILGGDGIKRLTDDTQKLMGQQMQLADAMKSMSPLLDQAKSLLAGFDMENLNGLASLANGVLGQQKA